MGNFNVTGTAEIDWSVPIWVVRKRPVEVEAVKFTGLNHHQIWEWMGETGHLTFTVSPDSLHIRTLEGIMVARPGDWIIKGVKGEFYPCQHDIFVATYDVVRESDSH